MKFTIAQDQGRVVQVVIDGCLTQQDIAPPIDPFRQILGTEVYQRTVLLDMHDCNYLDSMCIGWLLAAHKRFREHGGRLVMHSLQPLASNVISLLKLNTVFQMAGNTEKALQLVQPEVA